MDKRYTFTKLVQTSVVWAYPIRDIGKELVSFIEGTLPSLTFLPQKGHLPSEALALKLFKLNHNY